MSELARARARYEAAKDLARREAAQVLVPKIGTNFHLSGWSGKAREALNDQWVVDGKQLSQWDWNEIFRRHNDPDRLDIVIWGAADRLCGLSLCLSTSTYIEIRFLEGDPRRDCPLTGRRALIVLETAARYAQERGRAELRIQPVNERLETLYRQIYRFELATPHRGSAYYYKRV